MEHRTLSCHEISTLRASWRVEFQSYDQEQANWRKFRNFVTTSQLTTKAPHGLGGGSPITWGRINLRKRKSSMGKFSVPPLRRAPKGDEARSASVTWFSKTSRLIVSRLIPLEGITKAANARILQSNGSF